MRVFRTFMVGFLIFFSVFLLYFNFCLVNNINPFPGFLVPNNLNQWNDNYYFGFFSIVNAIDDFPNQVYVTEMDGYIKDFMNSLGGFANSFGAFDRAFSEVNIFAFFEGLFHMFISPLEAIFYFIKLIVESIVFLWSIIQYLFGIVSGRYNIPMPSEYHLDDLTTVISLTTDEHGMVTW